MTAPEKPDPNPMPNRYNIYNSDGHHNLSVSQSEDGEWVRYDDISALIAATPQEDVSEIGECEPIDGIGVCRHVVFCPEGSGYLEYWRDRNWPDRIAATQQDQPRRFTDEKMLEAIAITIRETRRFPFLGIPAEELAKTTFENISRKLAESTESGVKPAQKETT